MNITDLPIGVLTNVASFLPKPSRALFAISLTAPSSSWQDTRKEKQLSETSKAIMSPSSQWEILDFEEDEESLAEKLNDEDLFAVLTCIKQTVQRLKLTGCTNITGRGLAPLQFSTALELIDLSLLKQHEDASTMIESRINQEVVLSILGSIISVQGCLLKRIQFPYKWIIAPSRRLVTFHNSYMQYLSRLGIRSCSKCNNVIRGRMHTSVIGIPFCCYGCLKQICESCVRMETCYICKKVYCSRSSGCDVGGERCRQCRKTVCSGCSHNYMGRCSRCEARHCNNCLRNGQCEICREMQSSINIFDEMAGRVSRG